MQKDLSNENTFLKERKCKNNANRPLWLERFTPQTENKQDQYVLANDHDGMLQMYRAPKVYL